MKNKKIDDFLRFCVGNGKKAIIDKNKRISFGEFSEDCFKMKSLLGEKLPRGEKALVFVYPYSYLFYVLIFGGIMAGAKLVIIDSFADKDRVRKLTESAGCNYALTGGAARFLSFKLPKLKKIDVGRFKNYEKTSAECGGASVTTFTSGTTGFPKPVERSADFLLGQADFIRKNIKLGENEVVFCGLPMYSVLSVFSGYTTVISGKIKREVTAVITSIRKALSFPVCGGVKNGFLGGAILYGEEAAKISSVFPFARITYVYGATESALMYKTTLDKYRKDLFSFDEKIDGVSVGIENENSEGVGEISAQGDIVIAEKKHFTGDIGKISGGKLYVYGRKKYSMPEIGFYNYVADEKIREDNEDNKRVKAAFSFAASGKVYVIYKGKLTVKNPNYIYNKVKKIPYDAKHKTKLDYKKAAVIAGVYREF